MTWAEVMKWRPKPVPILALVGAAVGLFLIGGAVAKDGTLFGPTVASWVQAIGSVAAIIAAFVLARSDEHSRRQDAVGRELRALVGAVAAARDALQEIDQLTRDQAWTLGQARRLEAFVELEREVFKPFVVSESADGDVFFVAASLRRLLRAALEFVTNVRTGLEVEHSQPERGDADDLIEAMQELIETLDRAVARHDEQIIRA